MIKVSVIIPVFNEEKTILSILKLVKAQRVPTVSFEIVVVNDGSGDSSLEILLEHKSLYNKLVNMKQNKGKGAAIVEGIKASKGDFILFQDADLEYDPSDYSKLMEPIIRFNADLVLGSRMSGPNITRVSYFWNKQGNRLITFLFNVLHNTTFTDIYSCYIIFKRKLLNIEKLKTIGWEQQAEILSQVISSSRSHFEVPVNYYGRSYDEGKKIRPHHIFKILYIIITKRFF